MGHSHVVLSGAQVRRAKLKYVLQCVAEPDRHRAADGCVAGPVPWRERGQTQSSREVCGLASDMEREREDRQTQSSRGVCGLASAM